MKFSLLCRILIAISALIAVAVATTATASMPRDYAYGWVLKTTPGADLYRLVLTTDVYRNSHTADLTDIAIFNAEDTQVPHLLVTDSTPTAQQKFVGVPLFPIKTTAALEDVLTDLNIQRDTQGSIRNITIKHRAANMERDLATFYIADLSQLKVPVQSVRFGWNSPIPDFISELSIEGSNDLHNWTMIGSYTIASLERDGYTLQKNDASLPNIQYKYLRIASGNIPTEWHLSHLEMGLSNTLPPADVPPTVSNLRVQMHQSLDEGRSWIFDLGGPFLVEQLDLDSGDQPYLAHAQLFSANNTRGPWTPEGSYLFYSLGNTKRRVHNDPVKISVSRFRYWKFTFDKPLSVSGLTLDFTWRHESLVFVPEGTAPYKLAIGQGIITQNDHQSTDLSDLWRKREQLHLKIDPAVLIQQEELGGKSALVAHHPVAWQQLILWLVLTVGALVIVVIAIKLLRSGNGLTKP